MIFPRSVDVSVIVPTYNSESHVERAVRSALDQDGCEVQVIVVDDGSTDDTVFVVKSLRDSRITLVENDANRGPSFSRNRAISLAEGTWIAPLDSDDWFMDGRLRRLLEVARQYPSDMVADDVFLIRDGESEPFTSHFRMTGYSLPGVFTVDAVDFVESNKQGLRCLRLGVTKPIVRRSFLLDNNLIYDEDIRFAEDFRFYLYCLTMGAKFNIITEPMYYRRRHNKSITAGDLIPLLESDILSNLDLVKRYDSIRDFRVKSVLDNRNSEILRHLAYLRLVSFVKSPRARSLRVGDVIHSLGYLYHKLRITISSPTYRAAQET